MNWSGCTIFAVALFCSISINLFGEDGEIPADADKIRPKTWSFNIGPNYRNWNFVGISKDFQVSRQWSAFLTGGFGAIMFGAGLAYHFPVAAKTCAIVSATVGWVGAHGDFSFQWALGRDRYLNAGISYGAFFFQYLGVLPLISYEYRFR